MTKRGEITIDQIIVLTLAIAGFLVVIFLLWSLDFQSYSEDDICRLSVLSRGSLPESAQSIIPLKCATKKICISIDGSCSQFNGLNKKEIINVRLTKRDAGDDAKKIEKIYADSMLNCWKMMGEGKVDLFGAGKDSWPVLDTFVPQFGSFKGAHTTCFICSRVAIDEDLFIKEGTDKNYFENVKNNLDINGYIEDNGYLEKMTSDPRINAVPIVDNEKLKDTSNLRYSHQFSFLFMQILTKETPVSIGTKMGALTLVELAGVEYGVGGVKALVNPYVIGTNLVVAGATGIGAGLVQSSNRGVSAASCGKFINNVEDSKEGCTLLIPIDYTDINGVNEWCGRVEGSP